MVSLLLENPHCPSGFSFMACFAQVDRLSQKNRSFYSAVALWEPNGWLKLVPAITGESAVFTRKNSYLWTLYIRKIMSNHQ